MILLHLIVCTFAHLNNVHICCLIVKNDYNDTICKDYGEVLFEGICKTLEIVLGAVLNVALEKLDGHFW